MPAVKRKAGDDLVKPDFHQINVDVEGWLKTEKGLKLDSDSQLCRDNLSSTGCPLGIACPLRHTNPSALNFRPPPMQPNNPREREKVNTVCKHFLRGLCIMGKNCEFLHEYNLRKFPECWWFATWGFCSVGDECLYEHRKVRVRECPDFNRGFCRSGPDCPRKHIRRVLCLPYLAGFCPDGPACSRGHPSPHLPLPVEYTPLPPPLPRDIGPPPPGYGRNAEYDALTPQYWQIWQGGEKNVERYESRGQSGGGGGGAQDGPGALGRRGFQNGGTFMSGGGDQDGGGGGMDNTGMSGPPGMWPPAAAGGAGFRKRDDGFSIKPGMPGWKEGKDLEKVMCFRCGEMGHFPATCTNPPKPGDRGGYTRRKPRE